MRFYGWLWITLGCGIRVAIIMAHNFFHPEFPIYYTFIMCSLNAGGDITPACLVAGMAIMSAIVILHLFACMPMEFVPLYFSVGFRLAFDEINKEIMSVARSLTSFTKEVDSSVKTVYSETT